MKHQSLIEKKLDKIEMTTHQISIEKSIQFIHQSMDEGLKEKETLLPMIPSYLNPYQSIQPNRPVIAIDAGGTNFRVALISFDTLNRPQISDLKKYKMPGTQEKLDKVSFFDAIINLIRPVIDQSDTIGFCFSYSTEILPTLDARIIRLSKDLQVEGIEDCIIGQEMKNALSRANLNDQKKIILLNDTVSTLLASKTEDTINYGGYIGFVLGTGMNVSYVEHNKNISKISGLDENNYQAINTEFARIDCFPMNEIDRKVDAETKNPNEHLFEKKVSGAYLGRVAYHTIQMCGASIFSNNFLKTYENIDWETKNISDFLSYQYNSPIYQKLNQSKIEKPDLESLYFILHQIVDRNAFMNAIALAGIITKTTGGKEPLAPLCIELNGSTIHKVWQLKEKMIGYLFQILREIDHYYLVFKQTDDSALIGSAIAASFKS